MSTHEQIKERLTNFALRELSEQQSAEVEAHLAECPQCSSELKRVEAVLECAATMRELSADEQTCESAKDTLFAAVANQEMKEPTPGPTIRLEFVWRTIMRSRITKLAAAAAIIIAVLLGVSPFFEGTVTFAQVVEPILNAKTVIWDVIIGTDDTNPVMHEIVVGPRIRRAMSNLPGLVMIIDLDAGQMLVLDTAGKSGSYVSIEGQVKDRTQNYVDFLRQVIRQVKDGQVEKIGEQVIDGQKAIGFVGRGQNEGVTIWADPQTAHPIRIEAQIGQEFAFIMKNFEFDVPVDDGLVSMELPAGYTEEKATADLTDVNERDFVESLRIFAEVIGDGVFPEAVGTETTMKQMHVLVQKAQQNGISDEEIGQLGTKLGRGMIFHQILETQGQWRYAGAGVKLGDAGTAIFWYQPQGSETYRVIYGDLSVKDVAPEDLPK